MTWHNRIGARVFLFMLLVAASWIASISLGHLLVESLYYDQSGGLLSGLLANRDRHPLSHYLHYVTRLTTTAHFLAVLGASLYQASRSHSAPLCLLLLLIGDTILSVLSQIYGGVFDVRHDRGFPELFQYGKEISIAWFFYQAFAAARQRVFAVLAGLFAFFFLDDSFKYHETAGGLLVEAHRYVPFLASLLNVRPQDVGEILSLGLPLGVLAVALVPCYRRASADARSTTIRAGILVGLLVFFGVFVDLLDRMPGYRHLSVLEDVGEMVAMSMLFVFAASLSWKERAAATARSRARAEGEPSGLPVRESASAGL